MVNIFNLPPYISTWSERFYRVGFPISSLQSIANCLHTYYKYTALFFPDNFCFRVHQVQKDSSICDYTFTKSNFYNNNMTWFIFCACLAKTIICPRSYISMKSQKANHLNIRNYLPFYFCKKALNFSV